MNRFKTSKFKNTTPKIAKKDGWISNVRAGSFSCQGNHIKASSKLVAFNTEQAGGGMLGLSSVKPGSDGKWTVTQIPCHADVVTDLDFSPFDDNLLATCSADETMKLWRVCDPELEQPSGAELTLCPGQGRLELVLFHPTSSGLLALASSKSPLLWDTSRKDTPLAVLEQHSDQLQSLSWKQDGSLLASSCKDKMLRVFDPRAQLTPVQSAKSLLNNKDSRILWAKDDHLLTTGFDMMRSREVRLWDSRKLSSSVASVSLGSSSGCVDWSTEGLGVRLKAQLLHKAPLTNIFDQKTSLEKEKRPCCRKIFEGPVVLQRPKGQSWGAAGPFTLTHLGGVLGEQAFH
ncbi:coronin-7 [Centroberyx affinis]|uniref:coronin-7 n=1 Tax=Centroberyx affinis TaxID=166261 RepID=UPI003A5BBD15